jgi:hypothetical protein
MELNERIKLIRKHFCDGSNKKFAEMLGISPQNASTLTRAGKSIGKKFTARILGAFPVNGKWLLKGEGAMLKGDAPVEKEPIEKAPVEKAAVENAPAKKVEDMPESTSKDCPCVDNLQYVDVPASFLLTVIDRQSQAVLELNKTIAAQQQMIDNLLSKGKAKS